MAFAEEQDGCSSGGKQPPWKSPLLRAVLLAQVLSLLLCVMGTTSGLLAARGVNMPTTQAFFNYVLLGLTCGAYHLRVRGFRLSNPWYVYLLLAFLDVEANFLVTKAYQYTSVTSVTLLDCFTIPAVMALSALALRARYLPAHYAGALLCIGGLAVLVVTDGSSATGGPDPLLGNALVLMGAVLYACSNVAQERLLLGATPVSELLASVGGFGVLVGGLQAVVLERGAWLAADWSDPWAVAAPLAGFSLALYAFALLLPLVLVWSGATVLNISLLTSDVWAAGARVAFFGGFGGTAGWFAVSLACEAAGLVLYTHAGQTRPHSYPCDLRVGGGSGGEAAVAAGAASGGGCGAGAPYQRISSFGAEEGDSDVEKGRGKGAAGAGARKGGRSVSQSGVDVKPAMVPISAASAVVSAAAVAAAAAVSGLVAGVDSARGYGLQGTSEERRRLVGLEAEGSTEGLGLRGAAEEEAEGAEEEEEEEEEKRVAAGPEAALGPDSRR